MGTQVEIAKTITDGGGDYLLALKANWPALLADIETFFADPANRADCRIFDTVDADHGRLEQRHHRVCHRIDWLASDRRHPDHRIFPALATISMLEAHPNPVGKVQQPTCYYTHFAPADPHDTITHTQEKYGRTKA